MPTEAELLETKEFIRCACWNVIPLASVHCPYCKKFNNATTASHCPTCGQLLEKKV